MYEELKIDPVLHEYHLFGVVKYINQRLEDIAKNQKTNVLSELSNLLEFAIQKAGLKGNHLSLIKATLFKLTDICARYPTKRYDKNLILDELRCHRDLMENDLTTKIIKDEEDQIPKSKFYSEPGN